MKNRGEAKGKKAKREMSGMCSKGDEIMFHAALQEDLVPLILDRCVLRDACCKTLLVPSALLSFLYAS